MTLFYIPNSTQYLNLTTNLLTINTQQISNLLWEIVTCYFVIERKACNEWIYYQSSFYYMSNERKSWTESSKDCLKRRANLIIINNREEQVSERYCREFWIGLTDIDVEGSWKWVDGKSSTEHLMLICTFRFWASREPNGGRVENCAVTYLTKWPDLLGWLDVKCNNAYQWICEKSIWP
uniref:Zmp:0000000924 n=1 Tax=Sinocyclocheilus anshuiensis TaxID=1608454 RepID=A0A671L9G5_9TELE